MGTIADKLSAAGWTWGYCSAVTCDGWRWIVDAYREDGKRYIVSRTNCSPHFWSWKRRCFDRGIPESAKSEE